TIVGIGFVNVIATFFFYLNPSAYKIMMRIYGFVPPGTIGGTLGYRAGLADHYSQNGIFISIVIMGLGSFLVAYLNKKNKKKSPKILVIFIMFILSNAAMLLTSKRGPFIFSALTLITIYFIGSNEKISKNIVKFMIILVAVAVLILIAINYIPELSVTFERLGDSGNDDNSQARFEMWKLAFRIFKENPIIGEGTYSYREEYALTFPSFDDRYSYLNTHNVYLQVLAENGIIGFGLFLLAGSFSIIKTVKLVFELKKWKRLPLTLYATVLFALSMQIYFFIYSMTGNCLYDIVFSFYCCSIAIVNAIYLNRSYLPKQFMLV
ncbi:MAG: O-antigen ligase family protein, partial [Ruminococcus sp.]|nr:O-antigen ligase family protein [Ruminococcus sp.]